MQKLIKLNYGCGEMKLEGFINIDIEKKVKPDLVCDLRKEKLPYKTNSVETIYCIHNIEHIEYRYWPHVFYEFNRVLRMGGELVLMYPEFEVCVKYFLSNYKGLRDFWQATLYGRQAYLGDYHVTPVRSAFLSDNLSKSGFKNIKYRPEKPEEFNSILSCVKGTVLTREDVIRKEVFKIA